jgi:hypothetical protein
MSNLDRLAWLHRQARYRGCPGIDSMPEALFFTLAAMWRRAHRN